MLNDLFFYTSLLCLSDSMCHFVSCLTFVFSVNQCTLTVSFSSCYSLTSHAYTSVKWMFFLFFLASVLLEILLYSTSPWRKVFAAANIASFPPCIGKGWERKTADTARCVDIYGTANLWSGFKIYVLFHLTCTEHATLIRKALGQVQSWNIFTHKSKGNLCQQLLQWYTVGT